MTNNVTMRPVLVVSALVSMLSARCLGLELHFDIDSPASLDPTRRPCAVMTCHERTSDYLPKVDNDTSDLNGGVDTPAGQSILRLDIYRIYEYERGLETDLDSDGKSEEIVVSLTEEQDTVWVESEAIVARGKLVSDQADLRLEFYNPEDCQARFVCIAGAVDENGYVFARHNITPAVTQEGSEFEDGQDQANVADDNGAGTPRSNDGAPKTPMQIISLLEELHLKTASIDDRVLEAAGLKKELVLLDVRISSVEALMEDASQMLYATEGIMKTISLMKEKTSSMEGVNGKLQSVEAIREKVYAIECKLSKLEPIKEHCAEFGKQENNCNKEVSVIRGELKKISTAVRKDLERTSKKLAASFMPCHDASQQWEQATAELAQKLDRWPANFKSSSCDRIDQRLVVVEQGLSDDVQDLVLAEKNSTAKLAGLSKILQRLEWPDCHNVTNTSDCKNGGRVVSLENFDPYLVAGADQEERTEQIYVLCETHFLGSGWIVLQRRFTGELDFYRGWDDYRRGFGSFDGEFWIGLDKMHLISSRGKYELRIDLMRDKQIAYAHYATFSVDGVSEGFKLHLGSYSGTAKNKLALHNGQKFTTHDNDNDSQREFNCAAYRTGAWWYNACGSSNLNGRWGVYGNRGVHWAGRFRERSATFTEMKIRRVE